MTRQVVLRRKCFVAKLATKWFFLRVDSDMSCEIVLGSEALLTVLADLVSFVDATAVSGQFGLL